MKKLHVLILLMTVTISPIIAMKSNHRDPYNSVAPLILPGSITVNGPQLTLVNNIIDIPVPPKEIKVIFNVDKLPADIQNYIFLYLMTHVHGESQELNDFIVRFKTLFLLNKTCNEYAQKQSIFNQMIDNATQSLRHSRGACRYYAEFIANKINSDQAKKYIKIHDDLFSDDLEKVQKALNVDANPHYIKNCGLEYPFQYHVAKSNTSIISLLLESRKISIHQYPDAMDIAAMSASPNINDTIKLLLQYQPKGAFLKTTTEQSGHYDKFHLIVNNIETIHKDDLCHIAKKTLTYAAMPNLSGTLSSTDFLKKVCGPKFQHNEATIDELKLYAKSVKARAKEVLTILDQCNTYPAQQR